MSPTSPTPRARPSTSPRTRSAGSRARSRRPGSRCAASRAHVTWSGGDTLELAGIGFDVLDVPGHAPGHLSYYADGSLFSGDVLFAGGVGRVDLPGGDWDTLLDSIRLLAERYPPETVVYSGHGAATTLGAELARNPFLAELRSASQ